MAGRSPREDGERMVTRALPVSVRPAVPSDLEDVLSIERVSFSDPWTRDSFESAISLAHTRFLVAEEGEGEPGADVRVVGYVLALLLAEEGEIADIAVAPDGRRCGVGGLLLDRVIAETSARRLQALYLEVRESNVAARALYGSRGFEMVGTRRGYYRRPTEDALVLKRAFNQT